MLRRCFVLLLFILISVFVFGQNQQLRLIFIRHGEKAKDSDNLDCKGFNRSVMLPAVLFKKFGKPDKIYIPAVKPGSQTKHLRMLQTATPFVVKYDMPLNTVFDVDDYSGISKSLLMENGTVLIIWEHQAMPLIVGELGLRIPGLEWPSDDFDSIWIVTFKNGRPHLVKDREMLSPASACSF